MSSLAWGLPVAWPEPSYNLAARGFLAHSPLLSLGVRPVLQYEGLLPFIHSRCSHSKNLQVESCPGIWT